MHSWGCKVYAGFLLRDVAWLLPAVVLLQLHAPQHAAASANVSAVIFQGFEYSWLHKIAGFETPHRLGSVAAYIEDSSAFKCQFTPGVDGDFARPRLFYAALGERAPISSVSGLWHHVARDRAQQSEHPFAETSVSDRVVVAVGADSDAAVVLNGFNVSMQCDAACGDCNSNGAWVYSFNMSISNCSNGGNSVQCDIEFGLGRGWTPTHGGGKTFNLCMTYNITIYFAAIVYRRSASPALLSDSIEQLAWLSDGVATALRSLQAPQPEHPLFTGITAFGWDLYETGAFADRGRYLESYHFSLTQPLMSAGGNFTYNVSLGLSAPSLTTVPSRVRYHAGTLTLFAPCNDTLVATMEAVATVCKDDPAIAFYCSNHGMNASLEDTVPLQL
jgi:hypothetical protein